MNTNIKETVDTLFLFSEKELKGTGTNEGTMYEGERYIIRNTRIWTRSKVAGYASARTMFGETFHNYSLNDKFILRYGFCI